jgi:hypothetical protein
LKIFMIFFFCNACCLHDSMKHQRKHFCDLRNIYIVSSSLQESSNVTSSLIA